jgi:transitional endoplasmic reticulum ATPase
MPLEGSIDLTAIAQATKNFSGADLFALCREAAVCAMQRKSATISSADFVQALKAARPSITKEVEDWYEAMKKSLTYAMPKPIDKSFYG